jgi:hypothetical protein
LKWRTSLLGTWQHCFLNKKGFFSGFSFLFSFVDWKIST